LDDGVGINYRLDREILLAQKQMQATRKTYAEVMPISALLFENLQSYPYAVSGKNVAQGSQFLAMWDLCGYSRWFAGEKASNKSGVVKWRFSLFCSLYLPNIQGHKYYIIILGLYIYSPLVMAVH